MSSPEELLPPTNDLLLGIDGGGSKTVAWLAVRAGGEAPEVIGRGTAGGSNPQAAGFPAALENLDRAVAAAFADAGVTPRPVAAAVVALAGCDRDEDREALGRWAADRRLARRFRAVHDAVPVLAAGTPEGWGVALISGTGSFAFGQDAQGRSARSGGWGYLLGDEGSAYAIALAGLRAAVRTADGRAAPTRLLPTILQKLDLQRPEQLIPAVYQPEPDRAAIAGLAQLVLKTAEAGDAAAAEIVGQAARELAAMAAAVARRLDLAPGPFPLALAGSLLLGSEMLQSSLVTELTKLGLQAGPVGRVPEPVAGAVALALKEGTNTEYSIRKAE